MQAISGKYGLKRNCLLILMPKRPMTKVFWDLRRDIHRLSTYCLLDYNAHGALECGQIILQNIIQGIVVLLSENHKGFISSFIVCNNPKKNRKQ